MRALDLGLGVFWLMLGVAVCAQSLRLGMIGPFGPASGFFPFIAGLVLAVSAAVMLVSRDSRVSDGRAFWPTPESGPRVIRIIALLGLLVLIIPYAGFLLTGMLVTPVMLRIAGGAGWPLTLAIGLGAPAAIYFLFVGALDSPLPRGVLSGVL